MLKEISLPSSQIPAIWTYPDKDESNTRPSILFFNIHFNIILHLSLGFPSL
jgi:hypothetical protein